MSKEKQIEKEIEEMAHSLRIRKLDNEKIGFDVLSRLTGNAHEDEETSIARHIITQLCYRKQSEWISVEERLPEESGKYLVSTLKGNVYQTKFYEYPETKGGHWGQKDKGRSITHWMPLPEAPKGGAE